MDNNEIINRLKNIQAFAQNLYKEATCLIEQLEDVYSPAAPEGEEAKRLKIMADMDERSRKILRKAVKD